MLQITLKKDNSTERPFGSYLVLFEGETIGRVWKRQGGWWSWQSLTVGVSSSWCLTRKEAVERAVAFQWAEAEPSDDIKYRRIHKREFGEVICRSEEQD